MRRVLIAGLALAVPFSVAIGCSSDDGGENAEPGAKTTPSATSDGDVIEGKFDVGGHSLYLECRGTEPPTVLYLHGSITETEVDPHANGETFIDSLEDQHRVCVYDRRNLAHSDVVDEVQLPEDAIADLHSLLEAAEVSPPYVLLGASFGGLLSYLYANTYPDDVVGMVLLDSPFPDELSLEHLFKPEDTYEAFDAEDENESLERISHFKVLKASEPYIGREPAIPVTYLASITEGFDVNDYGIPEYDREVIKLQEAYVDRFAPGRYLRVDSPHFMEQAIPDVVTKELRRLLDGLEG